MTAVSKAPSVWGLRRKHSFMHGPAPVKADRLGYSR